MQNLITLRPSNLLVSMTQTAGNNVIFAPPEASTGLINYDFMVSNSAVRDSSGATVYEGPDMSAALNWAVSHADSVIYVPAGIYKLPDRVTAFANGTTLFGDGPNETVFHFVINQKTNGTAYWWFGFQPKDVSNIILGNFGITGDGCICFDTTTGMTKNNLVQDVTIQDTSDLQITSYGSFVSDNCLADGYKFIRCIAQGTGGDGFDLWGKSLSNALTVGGTNQNTYFEDCKALYCGVAARFWDWIPAMISASVAEPRMYFSYAVRPLTIGKAASISKIRGRILIHVM